jgi:hypothetical protein
MTSSVAFSAVVPTRALMTDVLVPSISTAAKGVPPGLDGPLAGRVAAAAAARGSIFLASFPLSFS